MIGFDPRSFGGAVERHGAIHGPVIGQGDGRLVQFDGALHKIVDAA